MGFFDEAGGLAETGLFRSRISARAAMLESIMGILKSSRIWRR